MNKRLTSKEVCEYYQIDRHTLTAWVVKYNFPCFKRGRTYRYPPERFEQWESRSELFQ